MISYQGGTSSVQGGFKLKVSFGMVMEFYEGRKVPDIYH